VVDPWAADRFWARCFPPRVSASAAGELDGRRSMPRIAGVSDRQADRRRTSPSIARLGFYKTGLDDGADRPTARGARPTRTSAPPTSPPGSRGSLNCH
jgi:hypothetical protein